jgi:transposase
MKPPKKKPNSIAELVPAVSPLAEKRVFTVEFKRAAVERMRQGDASATAVALELGIRRNQLYKWEKTLEGTVPGEAIRGRGRLPAEQESEVVRLRRQLASANEELAILKKFDAYLTRLKK